MRVSPAAGVRDCPHGLSLLAALFAGIPSADIPPADIKAHALVPRWLRHRHAPVSVVTTRWVDTGRWRMHVRTAGTRGPDIVCVHGVGVSSRYMTPLMCALCRDHRLHAVDLPGFGRSAKPKRALDVAELADCLARWLEAADLDRPVLLGNSFGCQVVVHLAAHRPRSVGGLVLVGPTFDPLARGAAPLLWRTLRTAPAESPRQLPILVRDFREAGLRRALQTYGHAMTDRIEDTLPRVHAPTLVVRGDRDRIVPRAWAEEVTRLLPHGRLVVLPHAGHTLNFTVPASLAAAVRAFMAEAT